MSLLNEALLAEGKPILGFINPLIYKIAASKPTAFYGEYMRIALIYTHVVM